MKTLENEKIWVCWYYSTRKGKRTKVPIAASGCTTGTDESYRCTWVTKAEAEKAAKEKHYDGIGFVLPPGYFFLDIDNRARDDPFVQMMLERFSSYAEYSVSGNGIHIYGKCDTSRIPTYIDSKGKTRLSREFYMKAPNDVELYYGGITNRFAVFTGNAIREVPLCDCTEALLTTLDKDMRRKKPTQKTKKRTSAPVTHEADADFDIIADLRKAKNGEKFIALYDKGDMSEYLHTDGTVDQSRADCALCALIAFRVGSDPVTIDRLFRGSALYRDKWEREDYRTSTIEKGIEACNGVFHRSVMPAPEFIVFDGKGVPHISIPLLAKYTKEHLYYILVRNDGKESVRLYVYENGVYRLYASDMLHAVIKGYIEEYDFSLLQMSAVYGAAGIITTDLNYVKQDELNADEGIINFQNGLLRLKDMKLLPHSPDVYSTIQLPCEWHGEPMPTPVFDRYLARLMDNDPEMINLCIEIVGAVISNVKCFRMKKSAFFVGDGNTGKSQLKSLVEYILGAKNYIGIDLREIEARFGTGAVYGTRLAGSADMSFMSVGELKTFKSLTGGDHVMAEFKGMPLFTYRYDGFLWFCMNRLPKFGGDDGRWVFDRIMVLNCPNVIPLEEQDSQLLEKMIAERDGIVFKTVMALKNVIANGYRFTEPEKVIAARKAYLEETNTALAFWNECVVERENRKITDNCTTGKIYDVYKAWCQDNNNGYAKTAREFRNAIADHLGKEHTDLVTHTRNGSFYQDYTLSHDAREHYSKAYGYDSSDFLT